MLELEHNPLSAPRRVSPYLRPHPDRAPALERKDPPPRRVSLPCHCARPHARGESSSNLSAPPLVAFRALGSALLLLPARPPPHTESCRAAVARRRRCHLLCFRRRSQARAPNCLRAARPHPYPDHPILAHWLKPLPLTLRTQVRIPIGPVVKCPIFAILVSMTVDPTRYPLCPHTPLFTPTLLPPQHVGAPHH